MTDFLACSDRAVTRELAKSYDALPYESEPLSLTHPDCLATAATLLGMEPAPAESCRLLELGCASGTNLIAMAVGLPGSRFLGVDVSSRQIARGREVAGALGLEGVELRALDLSALDPELGAFDYIVCHGVYSWVPPSLQDAILSTCRRHLAPHGVAFVSYNTYPGWHFREPVRDFLRWRARAAPDVARRVEIARDALDLLVRRVDDPGGWYAACIEREAALLAARPDAYLAHEHLDAVNAPVYFHQFVERARDKGLRFLCEASPQGCREDLPPECRDASRGGDIGPVELEQTLDFLSNRTFRTTLLCRAEVVTDAAPSDRQVRSLFTDTVVAPVTDVPGPGNAVDEVFRGPNDVSVTSSDPLVKATLMTLHDQRPRAIDFDTLLAGVRCRLPHGRSPHERDDLPGALARSLLRLHAGGAVRLHVHRFGFVPTAGDRPVASPLARYQAERGNRVVNLKHETLELTELERSTLSRLDGTRDRADLTRALAQDPSALQAGADPEGDSLDSADDAVDRWTPVLDDALERLAHAALLVG